MQLNDKHEMLCNTTYTVVQSQKAVPSYSTGKQILFFGFKE